MYGVVYIERGWGATWSGLDPVDLTKLAGLTAVEESPDPHNPGLE